MHQEMGQHVGSVYGNQVPTQACFPCSTTLYAIARILWGVGHTEAAAGGVSLALGVLPLLTFFSGLAGAEGKALARFLVKRFVYCGSIQQRYQSEITLAKTSSLVYKTPQ